jgi:BTB/POZ domain
MHSFIFLDADLHITSSDGIMYHVHKHRMSTSPVFADMFSLPTPEDETQVHNDSDDKSRLSGTSVELTESSDTLEQLLHFIYETDMVKPETMLLFNSSKRYTSPLDEYQRLAALFEAACKYEVEPAQRAVVDALQ